MNPAIDPRDRGLAYGDGLFETMRIVAGRVPLYEGHLARLARGCARLGIPEPAREDLRARVDAAARAQGEGVLKLLLTRGPGARGYAPPASPTPTLLLLVDDPWPPRRRPRVLRDCALRLAEQPALAGIKHTNRLEQVLARAEWRDPGIDDGLLCDAAGRVVSSTRANVYAAIDGSLVTPALTRCGVAGVARDCVLAALGAAVAVRDLWRTELDAASELILSNAVEGVMPVARLGSRAYTPGAWTERLAAILEAAGLPRAGDA